MGGCFAEGAPAFAGVDTHKGSHTLALLDALGRRLGAREFPADAAGVAELVAAAGAAGVPAGVEGARSYGAGVADALEAAGHEVYEVVRPGRARPRGGKSDAVDAYLAAEAVAAGRGLARKRLDGAAGELRLLSGLRDLLVRRCADQANWARSALVLAPERLRRRREGEPTGALMEGLRSLPGRGALERTLRECARSWRETRRRADALGAEIAAAVREGWPSLLAAPGVGPVTAAWIICAAGSNPGRCGSEAAFSMLCGTSPVPASSGATERHRLNRGGDRRANRAIHEIARCRMARGARTRAYVDRRVSEGKTRREAVRCLCRYIAREVYRLLTGPQEPLPAPGAARAAREAAGLSRAAAERGSGVPARRIALLESGELVDRRALEALDALYAETIAGLIE